MSQAIKRDIYIYIYVNVVFFFLRHILYIPFYICWRIAYFLRPFLVFRQLYIYIYIFVYQLLFSKSRPLRFQTKILRVNVSESLRVSDNPTNGRRARRSTAR